MPLKHATKIGLGLMIVSCIFYAGLFALPFLPFSTTAKAGIGTGIIVLGEGSFWLGVLIAGKEVMKRYRNYLNPLRWFRKKKA